MIKMYVFLSTIIFLSSQIIRAIRWQLLLPSHIKITKSRLTSYISIGSFINIFLPLNLGDFFRSLILSKVEKVSFSSIIISVIIERLTDVFSVLLIIIFYYQISRHLLHIEYFWFLGAFSLIACGILLKHYLNFRAFIFSLSKIWNSRIQLVFLNFFWLLFLQFRHQKFISKKYILLTCLMWLGYILSYIFFYLSVQTLAPEEVWSLFHTAPLINEIGSYTWLGYDNSIYQLYFIMLLTPILIAIFYELFSSNFLSLFGRLFFDNFKNKISLIHQGVPNLFTGDVADRNFLFSWFSKKTNLVSEIGILGFDDCKIIKFYHGNSGALTALIEKKEGTFIRKVAKGQAGKFLEIQYMTLKNNEKLKINFAKVSSLHVNKHFTFYEMPYLDEAKDMYDWVHEASLENSKKVFLSILNSIDAYHESNKIGIQENAILIDFLSEKVIKNIENIKSSVLQYIQFDNYQINGEPYSIKEWDFLTDIFLIEQKLAGAPLNRIHGDLTLENIIIDKKLNFYLIDPSPYRVYSSALMDWAKLFQSLNMGYENLSRNSLCSFHNNHIIFIHNKSERYNKLNNLLLKFVEEKFSQREIMQIELHEIIHYLRLIPYRFSKSVESGILFFAITCFLIRNFRSKYEIT